MNKAPSAPAPTPKAPSAARPSAKQGPKSAVTRDDLEGCRYCGRRFAADRLQVHENICAKTGKKKRKTYDATKHRVQGTELEQYVRKGKGTASNKVRTRCVCAFFTPLPLTALLIYRKLQLSRSNRRGFLVPSLPMHSPACHSDKLPIFNLKLLICICNVYLDLVHRFCDAVSRGLNFVFKICANLLIGLE